MATKKTEQDLVKNSFELWKNFTQTYADLAMETMQETVQQSLATREEMDKWVTETVNKIQELSEQEAEMIMDLTEKFSEQLRSATERISKLYTPGESE